MPAAQTRRSRSEPRGAFGLAACPGVPCPELLEGGVADAETGGEDDRAGCTGPPIRLLDIAEAALAENAESEFDAIM